MDSIKFLWLCLYILSFVISLLILTRFWKDEIIRLVGFYAILPGINMLILNNVLFWFNSNPMIIISAIIDIVFIIPIVYFFRDLYKIRIIVPWLLLVFDVFRWAWLIISNILSPNSTFSYFEAYLFYFYFVVPFVVLLFCIINRGRKSKIT